MKIAYINFWPQTCEIDFWLSNFCKTIFNEEISIVNHSLNPDILFSSCFGPLQKIKNTQAKIKIFFTGENLNRKEYNEYNDHSKMKEVFDIILGFDKTNIKNNIVRLPLWITMYNYYTMNSDNNLMNYLTNERKNNVKNKKFLGSLVCRHDRNGGRKIIYDALSKHGNVLCGGTFNNNINGIIGNTWKDKKDFLKQSIFNICPENSKRLDYCTEKIFHALESGCIPLYWGNDYPETNVLNKKSYCFLDIENKDKINKQLTIIMKMSKYFNSAELFKKEAKYVLDNYYKTFEWMIKQKLNKVEKQRIYGLSYASREFKDRIKNKTMFMESNYFDSFDILGENDVDTIFKEENKDIWYNSKRGGGWWIWKPYIIYKKLKEIKENDIIVYFDSGCQLCTTDSARKRFNEYIDMVNNHWSGHLRFLLNKPCLEKKYTNKYTVEYFKKRYNEKMEKHISYQQLVGGIQIVRKNKFTMDFFKEVLTILKDDKYLFCEKYTENNEFHRHDQSIMSLLYKVKNADLIIDDETWFGINGCKGNDDFGSELSKKYPIWAKRLRK
jgi:alpha(1,3/1,4) fucosyltransferase